MKLTGIRWSRRTAGIGAAAVVTAVAGTAGLVAVSFGEDGTEWADADGPVTTALHTVSFPAGNGQEVTIPKRDTKRFAMIGVTWTNPKIDFRGAISVRARAVGGDWSDWLPLAVDNPFGPEAGTEATSGKVRGGTDALWVGPSDGVEVRAKATGQGSSARLPAGLRLELIDPGQSKRRKAGAVGTEQTRPERLQPVAQIQALEPTPTPTPTPTDPAPTSSTAPEPTPTETTAPTPTETTAPAPTETTAPAPTTNSPSVSPSPTTIPNPIPTPKLVTRAGWQADESIVSEPPAYGTTIKGVFVHHTAGTNSYSCADSAAIVRGIQIYHVKSNGWEDIGYNFLVDKCGVLFEGRKGGIDKPVIGAHTYGFNTNNAGIAVLGTYSTSGVSTTVQDVIAHVAAYKLGQYRNDPYGTVTQVSGVDGMYDLGESVVMNRIAGHRDAVPTECPGNALYAQLRSIRIKAATMSGLALTGLTANKSGTTYYTRGSFTASWSVGTPSALIDRFEVLVDGNVVATTAGTARSAAITVAPGAHSLQIRGVHRLGRTVTTAGQAVVGDTTLPTFPRAPMISLRTGTVSTSSVPVVLSWQAADNAALRGVYLTSPSSVTFSPSTTSWKLSAKPGVATTWSMRAVDWAGNAGTSSASRTTVLTAETSGTRSSGWSTTTSTSHLSGSALTSITRNASLRWTFTGRSVAFIAQRTTTSGQVNIYVDGVRVTTVDLRSSSTAYRQAVWTKTWSTSGTHTVTVVVVGTSGRPRVTADGIAVVR